MSIIEHELSDLAEKCKQKCEPLTEEQIDHIRVAMAEYAIAALMDSSVAKEAQEVSFLANP